MPRAKKSEVEKVTKKIKDVAEEVIEGVREKIEDINEALVGDDKEETKKEKKPRKKKTEKAEKVDEKKELTEEEKEKLRKILMKKAKKLAEKIEGAGKINVEEVRAELKEAAKKKRNETTLFPLDDYVKYSSHLGTKAVTPHMREYVYKRRADGLAVLNTNSIDEKLKEAVEFLKDFSPEDIFIACKREAGWKAAKKFSEVTGIRVFTKKYPAGVLTNIQLDDFFEAELIIICDPWLDKNALNDAIRVRKPVLGLCDTNNLTRGLTKVVPCNNKAAKSLGLILYLLAREYLKLRGHEKESKALDIEDFTGVVEDREDSKGKGGAEQGV